MRTLLFLFFIPFVKLAAQQPLPPVGFWRDHLPYNSAIDLAASNDKIYCAAPYSLFSINTGDKSIERLSKTSGLSETGINAIHYDNANEKLVIAYDNSNIDVIYRNDIINVPDFLRDNIVGDKKVFDIYSLDKNYYLSTGLGVVVLDGERYEIKESWLIGKNGSQVKVNAVSSDANFFYVATEEGLKKAATNTNNLSDYNNWQLISGTNGLSAGACQNVLTIQNKVIVQKDDALYIQDGSNWVLFYQDGWPIVNANVSANKIFLCQRKTSGESKVTILDINGTVLNTLMQTAFISFPQNAIESGNEIWIADEANSLISFDGNSYEQYKPNSPNGITTDEIIINNQVVYAASGGVDQSWSPQNNKDGISIFKEGKWKVITNKSYSRLDSLKDFISISIDPKDETIWAGSFGGGLLHVISDHQVEIFKQNLLQPEIGDPSSYRVAGLAFDKENNLWISNYGAAQSLVVKKSDGAALRFASPFSLTGNALTQIIVDDNNYKWIVAAKGNGLLCYDHGASLENTGDDRWKRLTTGSGNGNLPDNNVLCIAKDKNGFIWVGTTNGIAVIQCPQEIFTAQGCEAIWPVVQQGNFAGYLFSGEVVNGIAIDGADRKWIATKKGVWLISASGEKVIYQFTEANSSLLSNDVKKIAIDGKTGEVYFATSKGICSFRSTATEGGETNEDVLVFPNPVPPGYSGTIAIRGLVNNAIVKITELDGRLVFQTRAAGGQAVWNGRDYKGRKISTGIYLVLVSDDERTEKKAGKIVFVLK